MSRERILKCKDCGSWNNTTVKKCEYCGSKNLAIDSYNPEKLARIILKI